MKQLFTLAFFFLVFLQNLALAQCEVTATALPQAITCGTCVTLTAFGEGQGNSIFTESFNTGAPTGWQSTAQATYTNPCDANGVDGTTHLWMGDATGVPRQLTTTGFNFTTATAGATICFDMIFAEQGDASPCEGPDEPDEGVYLQYSINGGATWIDINYFDPNGGNDASLINWNNWCFAVPAAALTANTQFRWFQDNDSGAEYDHWGLDNVNIYFNDPTFNITWQHDGFSYGIGNAGGANPNLVCPQTTTTYTVTMSNGTTTCTDQVTVSVTPPVFRVSAAPDTSICVGQCVDLLGEATVVVSPAKTPNYENSEIAALTGFPSASDLVNILVPCFSFGGCSCPNGSTVPFGATCPAIFNGTLSMNINITDLNTTTLQNGELTQVCIGDAIMLVGNFTPFQVSLTCPSGASIILANAGNINGTTLNNTCFDLVSTTPISAGASPYSGNFQPINPLTNLTGCDANGVWTLNFTGNFNLSSGTIPVGFLNGWDISFDDPEISYEGDFVWSPNIAISAVDTLTPNVCPTVSQTYTISVQDTAGCASDSASVFVEVTNANCCPFEISYTNVLPSCGNADGSIAVSITNGSGNYTYAWTNGLPSTASVNNVASGTYTLTVTDLTLACQKDTIIQLLAPNAPLINSVQTDTTSCGLNNGIATVSASGGTGALSYSIDGVNFQLSNVFANLAAGAYSLTVEDALSCSSTFPFTIVGSTSPSFASILLENTSCGLNNGSIQISAANGLAPYQFSINNGASFSNNANFSNLAANTYTLVIEDNNSCTVDSIVSILTSTSPTIDSINATQPSCGVADGALQIFASGGQTPYSYSINNGTNSQALANFVNIAAGTYQILVQDADTCIVTQNFVLNSANAPVIDSIPFLDPSCANNDGSLQVFASGGTAPLSYSIDNGVNFQANSNFTALAAGSYTVVAQDDLLCESSQIVVLTAPAGPNIDSVQIVDASCGLTNGTLNIIASGGVLPYAYSIDNGANFNATSNFSNLTSGTYNIVVEGNDGCSSNQTINLASTNAPSFSSITVNATTCGLNNGNINMAVSGGIPPLEYSIDNGLNFQNNASFNNLSAGFYTLVVREQGNILCFVDSIVEISGSTAPIITNVVVSNETCEGFNDGTIALSVSGGTVPYAVTYNGQSGSLTENNLSDGTYTIIVSDSNNCSVSSTESVLAGLNVSVSTINDTSLIEGSELVLTTQASGGTNTTFSWSPSFGLSCFDCQNPNAILTESIQYIVTYTDSASGCSASDAVNIEVILEEPFCLFPTAFSPNNDLVNDGYGAICRDLVYLELKIYNRWGELIFAATDNNDLIRWDGKYKEKEAPLDVYIYVANIEYLNGKVETLTGNFTLIK